MPPPNEATEPVDASAPAAAAAPEVPAPPEAPALPAPPEAAALPEAPEMTAAACAARLAELFPALFGTDGPPRPVKLRVHADVQQRAPGVFTRRVLSSFLARHTTTSAYLRALVESPHRFDLDGQPAGEIAEEHRQAAREELARRRALRRGPPGRAPRPGAPASPPPTLPATPPGVDAQPARETPAAERPPRGPRPEGPARPGRPDRNGRKGQPPRPSRPAREPPAARPADTPQGDARRPAAPVPVDPAQRARQMLVRAWESSPLAKPNFCALMRVSVAELDAAIEQVQQERRARVDDRPAR